jgi:hypothetical protein
VRIAGLSRVVVAAGIVAMGFIAAGSASAAVSPEGWSLSPAAGHGARAYIQYSVADRQTVHDAVELANPTNKSISFDLYPASAFNEPVGGAFALGLEHTPKTGAARWIKLAVSHLTVPPGLVATIPVTIHIPANASPGDRAAGIVALDNQVIQSSTGGQVALGVEHAVGVRVYLKVAGPRRSALAVRNVEVRRSGVRPVLIGGGNATIAYNVRNTGNTRLDAVSSVKVVNEWGHVVHRFPPVQLLTLLPGANVHLTDAWKAPRAGRFRIKVTVTSGRVTATGQTSVLIVPWLALIGLFGGIAAALAWLHHHRHLAHLRHLRHAPAAGASDKTPVLTR